MKQSIELEFSVERVFVSFTDITGDKMVEFGKDQVLSNHRKMLDFLIF